MIAYTHALLERAVAANPAIHFTRGMPRSLWLSCLLIGVLAALFVPLGLLAAVLATVQTGPEGPAGAAIAAAIVLTGWIGLFLFLIRWIRRNRPRRFCPLRDDLLAD